MVRKRYTQTKKIIQKYRKIYAKLQKALQSDRFGAYTSIRQNSLLQRLERYEKRLSRWGIAVASASALFMSPAVGLSQTMPVGNETKVNTFTTNYQTKSAIAIDSDGDFVVAWLSEGQNGEEYGIYGQRYDKVGTVVGGEFKVNTTTFDFETPIDVAMDDDGDFVVVWQRSEQAGGGATNAYARRYNNTGMPIGGEFKVNTGSTPRSISPSVAMDSDGDFVVAWSSLSQSGYSSDISAQRYDKMGAKIGSEFIVNTDAPNSLFDPKIAMDDDGDFVVTWFSENTNTSEAEVYARRFDKAGMAVGSAFRVNTYTTDYQRSPDVAIDSDGDFVVVWGSGGQDGSYNGVYAQRYDKTGMAVGGEFKVSSYTTYNQQQPSVSMDDTGSFVVNWESERQDGDGNGIYAQLYDNMGVVSGSEFRVNTSTANYQGQQDVAMDDDGDFVTAWLSNHINGESDIYMQRYATACMSPTATLAVTETSGATANDGIVANGDAFTLTASGGTTYQFFLDKNNNGTYESATDTNLGTSNPLNSTAGNTNFPANMTTKVSVTASNSATCTSASVSQDIQVLNTVNINAAVVNTCTKPYTANFPVVSNAVAYRVEITVPAPLNQVLIRTIGMPPLSSSINIPNNLIGKMVSIRIAPISVDPNTGQQVVGMYSSPRGFMLGCNPNPANAIDGRSEEIPSTLAVEIAPNPVQNDLRVSLEYSAVVQVQVHILDVTGRLIQAHQRTSEVGENQWNLNTSTLPSGLYYLQIQTAETSQVLMFVKE